MDLFRDLLGLLRRGRLAAVVRFAHPRLAALEVGAALGANADELDLHALGLERSDALLSLLDRRRVVGPAEPAVAGDADETDLLAQNSSIYEIIFSILAKVLKYLHSKLPKCATNFRRLVLRCIEANFCPNF